MSTPTGTHDEKHSKSKEHKRMKTWGKSWTKKDSQKKQEKQVSFEKKNFPEKKERRFTSPEAVVKNPIFKKEGQKLPAPSTSSSFSFSSSSPASYASSPSSPPSSLPSSSLPSSSSSSSSLPSSPIQKTTSIPSTCSISPNYKANSSTSLPNSPPVLEQQSPSNSPSSYDELLSVNPIVQVNPIARSYSLSPRVVRVSSITELIDAEKHATSCDNGLGDKETLRLGESHLSSSSSSSSHTPLACTYSDTPALLSQRIHQKDREIDSGGEDKEVVRLTKRTSFCSDVQGDSSLRMLSPKKRGNTPFENVESWFQGAAQRSQSPGGRKGGIRQKSDPTVDKISKPKTPSRKFRDDMISPTPFTQHHPIPKTRFDSGGALVYVDNPLMQLKNNATSVGTRQPPTKGNESSKSSPFSSSSSSSSKQDQKEETRFENPLLYLPNDHLQNLKRQPQMQPKNTKSVDQISRSSVNRVDNPLMRMSEDKLQLIRNTQLPQEKKQVEAGEIEETKREYDETRIRMAKLIIEKGKKKQRGPGLNFYDALQYSLIGGQVQVLRKKQWKTEWMALCFECPYSLSSAVFSLLFSESSDTQRRVPLSLFSTPCIGPPPSRTKSVKNDCLYLVYSSDATPLCISVESETLQLWRHTLVNAIQGETKPLEKSGSLQSLDPPSAESPLPPSLRGSFEENFSQLQPRPSMSPPVSQITPPLSSSLGSDSPPPLMLTQVISNSPSSSPSNSPSSSSFSPSYILASLYATVSAPSPSSFTPSSLSSNALSSPPFIPTTPSSIPSSISSTSIPHSTPPSTPPPALSKTPPPPPTLSCTPSPTPHTPPPIFSSSVLSPTCSPSSPFFSPPPSLAHIPSLAFSEKSEPTIPFSPLVCSSPIPQLPSPPPPFSSVPSISSPLLKNPRSYRSPSRLNSPSRPNSPIPPHPTPLSRNLSSEVQPNISSPSYLCTPPLPSPLIPPFPSPLSIPQTIPPSATQLAHSDPQQKLEIRHHCCLHLELRGAKDLWYKKGDLKPFVSIQAFGVHASTKPNLRNGKNPSWGESFIFDLPDSCLPHPMDLISFVVFHENETKSKHEIVGEAALDLRSLQKEHLTEFSVPVVAPDLRQFVMGQVELKVAVLPSHLGPKDPSLSPRSALLWVQIVKSRNFRVPKHILDYHIRATILKTTGRTKSVRPSSASIFCDHVFCEIPWPPSSGLDIHLNVHGHLDLMVSAVVNLGSGVIHLDKPFFELWLCPRWQPVPFWVSLRRDTKRGLDSEPKKNLEGTDRQVGKLNIRSSWIVTRILGSYSYQMLSNLILHTNDYLAIKVMDWAIQDSRELFCNSLIPLLIREGHALPFISSIGKGEVTATPHASVLFRGNSLFTKCMDQFQKVVCARYLKELIQPWMNVFYEEKDPMELDPNRLEKQDDLIHHRALLLIHTQLLLDMLFQSVKRVPLALKVVFAQIRKQVLEQFDGAEISSTAQYTCISSFFFLRLLCPCLLCPVAFGIHTQHPPSRLVRPLKLVAKLVQNLSNLVEFGLKESFMESLNPFLRSNFNRMKGFLDSLCQIPSPIPNFRPSLDESGLETRDLSLARIHLLLADKVPRLRDFGIGFGEAGEERGVKKEKNLSEVIELRNARCRIADCVAFLNQAQSTAPPSPSLYYD